MQPLFSDVTFRVEGTLVHSHKLVLCTRCDVMSAMLTGGFAESQSNEVYTNILIVSPQPINLKRSVGNDRHSNNYIVLF
jgi:hypothetical protein